MKRILAIVDRDPFPPRNGETIPAAAHVRALAECWEVDIACVGFAPRHAQQAPAGVGWLSLTAPEKRRPLRRAVHSLRGGLPGQVDANPLELLAAAAGRRYDMAYLPLLRLLPWGLAAKRCFDNLPLVVNVSDAPSEVCRRHRQLALTAGLSPLFRAARLARSFGIQNAIRWESRAAAACDLLLVQSENDRAAIAQSAPDSADRVTVARNGVDQRLFAADYRGADSKRLIHLGPVVGERRHLLLWFVKKVFLPLRRRCPDVALDVVGSISPGDKDGLQSRPGVICHGFVDSLLRVVESASASVAPMMMRYGLINKVAESLAAGLPCTGLGAFNGLPGFCNQRHGVEVGSAAQWVEVLAQLLNDPPRLRQLSAEGRAYALSHLRWEQTDRLLQSRASQLIELPRAGRAA